MKSLWPRSFSKDGISLSACHCVITGCTERATCLKPPSHSESAQSLTACSLPGDLRTRSRGHSKWLGSHLRSRSSSEREGKLASSLQGWREEVGRLSPAPVTLCAPVPGTSLDVVTRVDCRLSSAVPSAWSQRQGAPTKGSRERERCPCGISGGREFDQRRGTPSRGSPSPASAVCSVTAVPVASLRSRNARHYDPLFPDSFQKV